MLLVLFWIYVFSDVYKFMGVVKCCKTE